MYIGMVAQILSADVAPFVATLTTHLCALVIFDNCNPALWTCRRLDGLFRYHGVKDRWTALARSIF